MTQEPIIDKLERLEREPCENFAVASEWSCLTADDPGAPWSAREWCHPCVRAEATAPLLSQLRDAQERAERAEARIKCNCYPDWRDHEKSCPTHRQGVANAAH